MSKAGSRRGRSCGVGLWSVIGGAALVLVAVGIISQFPDLKRYVKMTTM